MGYALLFMTILAVIVHKGLAADVNCKKHPERVNPKECCPMVDIISDEVKEKCKGLMKSSPSPISGVTSSSAGQTNSSFQHKGYHGPRMHSCFMSCVLNETGIATAMDGKLNEEKLSAYLKVVLNDYTNLIPMVETSFKTCSNKAEKLHAKIQEKNKNKFSSSTPSSFNNVSRDSMMRDSMVRDQPRCPPLANFLIGCVSIESLMNCPKSVWSNTKQCNDMRDHMKQCMHKDMNSSEDSDSNSTEEDM